MDQKPPFCRATGSEEGLTSTRTALVSAAAGLVLLLAACGAPPTNNVAPTISQINDQSIGVNQSLNVAFTVTDEAPGSLDLSAHSSDQTLVADSAMTFGGSGANRTLTITPAADAVGTTTITITATDLAGLKGTASFELEVRDPVASQGLKLTASDAATNDMFGSSVAISGDYAVVGAPRDDLDLEGGFDAGSAYVFHRMGDTWTEQAKLTALDAAADDWFGLSVAISGDDAIVGAYGDDDHGSNSGSAYIFHRTGDTWTEQAKLTASDAAAGDRFGGSVAISGDYAIVGAPWDPSSGSAYVFRRMGDIWTEQAKLRASDAAAGDHFGNSVAISGDYAIVGAYGDDDHGSNSGSAYIFRRTGDTWTELAKLTAADAAADDYFGLSVAISGDDAIVGAYGDDDHGSNSGSAYIFHRMGDTWTQQAKLTASDAAARDSFGNSVAIIGDAAIVGAYPELGYGGGDGSGSSGFAYIFHRLGDIWIEQAKLRASNAAVGDWFGRSVAIIGDAAIVGASRDDDGGIDSGAAYIFSW